MKNRRVFPGTEHEENYFLYRYRVFKSEHKTDSKIKTICDRYDSISQKSDQPRGMTFPYSHRFTRYTFSPPNRYRRGWKSKDRLVNFHARADVAEARIPCICVLFFRLSLRFLPFCRGLNRAENIIDTLY